MNKNNHRKAYFLGAFISFIFLLAGICPEAVVEHSLCVKFIGGLGILWFLIAPKVESEQDD